MARRYTYATCLSWGGDVPTAELDVEVSYVVIWGRPAQTYGPAENCYPADPDEIDDIRVETIDGTTRPAHFADAADVNRDLEAAIIEKLELSDEHYARMLEAAAETDAADYDAAMERRWEDQREAL